jgi:hypothetical protein
MIMVHCGYYGAILISVNHILPALAGNFHIGWISLRGRHDFAAAFATAFAARVPIQDSSDVPGLIDLV